MIELKPCPFCGQEPEQRNSKYNPYARCATPDCAGGKLPLISLDVPEDIERWNRRGREQALVAHVEAIADAINDIDPDRGVSLAVDIIDQCPATSLARRDARMKVEALERAIRVMGQHSPEGAWVCFCEDLQAVANEYRRQAEESQE